MHCRFFLFLALPMLVGILAGCGGSSTPSSRAPTPTPSPSPSPRSDVPTAEEQQLADLIATTPGQGRAEMHYNVLLAQAARDHARDMAVRDYFDHVTLEGYGPNYRVRQTGYILPAAYSTAMDANQVEALAVSENNPAQVLTDWLNQAQHRPQILGATSFFAAQTNYGIGHYYAANSRYKHYWVFISAPPTP